MKMVDAYKNIGVDTKEAVFDYFMNNLKDTIRTHDFYVAWEKVLHNISIIEVSLNIMNSLIGKTNIEQELKALIKSYPEVVPIIPILLACRESALKIADIGGDLEYSFKIKASFTDEEINKIVSFASKSGLLKILSDKSIKNLVDYCLGVEVGLDTNARKNRSGTVMENLIEVYIDKICKKHNYRYLARANVSKIKDTFGEDVPTNKTNRIFDFVISTGSRIYLLEVNFYGSSGTKLKAVAGEFTSLSELVKSKDNVGFIWITDGLGWPSTRQALLETFNAIDFVLNIKMIEDGILEEIITKGL